MQKPLFQKFLVGFFILNVIYMIYTLFTNFVAMGDELEHIHASWLVLTGEIPYRDFFEHHHPLTWFLFAPLVGLFEGNIFIFYVMRLIMGICSLATLYIIFKLIKKYLADSTAAWLAINIFCFSTTVLNTLVQFKPDILMHLCFWIGTYNLFGFIEGRKQSSLNICAVFYTLAFLFLQTSVFLILPLLLPVSYLLYTKKLSVKSLLIASITPLFMLIGAFAYLYFTDSLQRYYELNWVVNAHIATYHGYVTIADFSDLYGVLLLGLLAAIYILFNKPNLFLITIILMYFTELLLRVAYLSPYLYYFKQLLLYNAILLGYVIAKIYQKQNRTAYLILILFIPCLFKIFPFQSIEKERKFQTSDILGIMTDINKNTTPDDTVLGINATAFGIFNKNPHYYWFGWQKLGKIDHNLFSYTPEFDINKIITEVKPKFVYFEDDLRPNYVPTELYDIKPEILHKYYEKIKYNTLYIRK